MSFDSLLQRLGKASRLHLWAPCCLKPRAKNLQAKCVAIASKTTDFFGIYEFKVLALSLLERHASWRGMQVGARVSRTTFDLGVSSVLVSGPSQQNSLRCATPKCSMSYQPALACCYLEFCFLCTQECGARALACLCVFTCAVQQEWHRACAAPLRGRPTAL